MGTFRDPNNYENRRAEGLQSDEKPLSTDRRDTLRKQTVHYYTRTDGDTW